MLHVSSIHTHLFLEDKEEIETDIVHILHFFVKERFLTHLILDIWTTYSDIMANSASDIGFQSGQYTLLPYWFYIWTLPEFLVRELCCMYRAGRWCIFLLSKQTAALIGPRIEHATRVWLLSHCHCQQVINWSYYEWGVSYTSAAVVSTCWMVHLNEQEAPCDHGSHSMLDRT